jgi:RNA polymerase sigma factor (sigma-70 family)
VVTRPDRASDESAIVALSARYRSAIMAFFSRRISDRNDVEDMTQDVFVSLTRRAELDTIDNAERYIFQIAANLLRDRFRLSRIRPVIESEGYADPNDRLIDEISPERELLGREAYAAFTDALQELPERVRMIFVLNRFEEMPGREIAIALGVSQRLVEKDISRVLKLLRERLK